MSFAGPASAGKLASRDPIIAPGKSAHWVSPLPGKHLSACSWRVACLDSALCDCAGFGHKAGYLPPPQSIKAQVMSGTLLSSSKEPVAPPPFNPSLSAKKSGASTASSAPSPPPTAVKSDDDSAAAPDSSDASDAAPANDAPALPVSGMRTPYMCLSRRGYVIDCELASGPEISDAQVIQK